MSDYLPESEVTAADIADGRLIAWRTDANGVQWYRTPPIIFGVDDSDVAAVDDDDDPRTGWWGWFRGLLDGDSDDDD